MMWVLLDGQIVPPDRAQVPVLSRALLYGDGLFETLRAYQRRLFDLTRHLDRMERSAEALRLPVVWNRADLTGQLHDLVTAVGADDAYLRLTLCRGVESDEGFWFAHARALQPDELHASETALRLAVSPVRQEVTYPWHRHKTLHYAWRWAVRRQAQQADADDALLLNSDDELAETTAANVFVVVGDQVLTPPLAANILPGIVRSRVFEVCDAVGLACAEKALRLEDLRRADEIFLTNSVREMVPVCDVLGWWRAPAPGPVTTRLLAAYRDLVADELNLS